MDTTSILTTGNAHGLRPGDAVHIYFGYGTADLRSVAVVGSVSCLSQFTVIELPPDCPLWWGRLWLVHVPAWVGWVLSFLGLEDDDEDQ